MYRDLLELMRGRRSVRRFKDQPLAAEQVERLLEAARWAPSAGNRQAWRFLLVRSAARRAQLREVVATALRGARHQLRQDAAADVERYLADFVHFAGAPLIVAPIYRGADLLQASQGGQTLASERAERDALCSVAAAIQNLLLAAHSLGLGACWMTGPLLAGAALERALDVPAGWSLAALIPVGIPDESPAPPPRRALARLIRDIDGEGMT